MCLQGVRTPGSPRNFARSALLLHVRAEVLFHENFGGHPGRGAGGNGAEGRGVPGVGERDLRAENSGFLILPGQSLRFLAQTAKAAALPERTRRLALWTSQGWARKRPVYAVEDLPVADGLAEKVAVWLPGGEVSQFKSLLEPFRLTRRAYRRRRREARRGSVGRCVGLRPPRSGLRADSGRAARSAASRSRRCRAPSVCRRRTPRRPLRARSGERLRDARPLVKETIP